MPKKIVFFFSILFGCINYQQASQLEPVWMQRLKKLTPDELYLSRDKNAGNFGVKGAFRRIHPSVALVQLRVANQEPSKAIAESSTSSGGGACGMHAMLNFTAIAEYVLMHGDSSNLAEELFGKRKIRALVGNHEPLSGLLRNQLIQLYGNDGEWLSNEQIDEAMKKIIYPSMPILQKTPFGVLDIQAIQYLQENSRLLDDWDATFESFQLTPEIAHAAGAIAYLRRNRELKQPFLAGFIINTATDIQNKGHWFTTMVNSNKEGDTQFIITDSENTVRLYRDPNIEKLIQLVTKRRYSTAYPEPKALLEELERAVTEAEKGTPGADISHIFLLLQRVQSWCPENTLPAELDQRIRSVVNASFDD